MNLPDNQSDPFVGTPSEGIGNRPGFQMFQDATPAQPVLEALSLLRSMQIHIDLINAKLDRIIREMRTG